jgi:ketosteroid isomerase-like protein
MPTQTAAMLQSLYVAYREKRLADVAPHLADDFRFTMHLPADALPGAATPHGKAEALALFEGLLAAYDILLYEPGPIMVTGDQAAVRVRIRYRHKATDAVIETTIGHFWRTRDGKVVQLDEYHNVQHVLAFLHKVASGG